MQKTFKPDPEQAAAVAHYKGPALVLAPPGSGKTAVLTMRIADLVLNKNVHGESILVITFTKDAALSMEKRFRGSYPDINGVTFATFHSFFYNILRSSGSISSTDIIFEKQKIPYIKKALLDENIKLHYDSENVINEIMAFIGYYLNTNRFHEESVCGISSDDMMRVIRRYQMLKLTSGVIDFDDMIYRTYHELLGNKALCEKYRKKYEFILVDEAQDMNDLQYKVLRLILGPDENLFMVGDDDQSIYGFRGANPALFGSFQNEFKDPSIYFLKTNYRCDRVITAFANRLIAFNNMRYDKQIIPFSKKEGNIFLIESKDAIEEAEKITMVIRQIIGCNISPEKIAVLYRKSSLATTLLTELLKSGIPVFAKERFYEGYDNFVRRDVMTYIRLARAGGKGKREDFVRIMNRPGRFLQGYLFTEEDISLDKLLGMRLTESDKNALMILKRDLDFLAGLSPNMSMVYIRKGIGYDRYLDHLCIRYNRDRAELLSMIDDVENEAAGCSNLDQMLSEYENRLDEAQFLKEKMTQKKSPDGKISFHTFHASKGLEFDNVFMIGCSDGDTPSSKASSPEELEEERRMFYVAMTRAKHNLYISLTGQRANMVLYPSRFIRECGLSRG